MYDLTLFFWITISTALVLLGILLYKDIRSITRLEEKDKRAYKYLDGNLLELEAKERKEREEALALEAQEKEEMKQLLQNLLKCQQVMARAAKENNRLLAELIQVLKERQD
ncbi:hypothetical protein [Limnofasciculus baicalensis]|uniref:Uncharacterized protein n=1 Tax=Limnofasciculus baicalensis BBK-W-15 TaxID=2699891 RepID=A0AAE3KQG8_9CYAN|nr:hypothetical protein [Limnofasciculus baicalensis]MCP2727337.1 hypothetical protein [Limnofasciculus baicalensis BBK-W-15]